MDSSREKLESPESMQFEEGGNEGKGGGTPHTENRKFLNAVCYILIGQNTIGLLGGFITVMVYALRENNPPIFLTVFQCLALLQFAMFIWASGFVMCFATNNTMILLTGTLSVGGGLVSGAVMYFFYGWVPCVLAVLSGVPMGLIVIANRRRLLSLSSSPLNNLSVEMWISSVKLIMTIITPVIAQTIQNGEATQVAFYSVLTVACETTVFCALVRFMCALRSTKRLLNLFELLKEFPVPFVIPIFGARVLEFLIFGALFLLNVSGVDRNGIAGVDYAAIALLLGFYAMVAGSGILAVAATIQPPFLMPLMKALKLSDDDWAIMGGRKKAPYLS